MAKLVVSEFVSLDGVMQAPGGEPGFKHSGWVMAFPAPDQLQYKLDEVLAHEALLIGRRTYEGFAAAWPSRTGEFADKMNGMPKYVASTTLKKVEWNNSTVLSGDVPAAVSGLKQELGGDILVAGSHTLVNTLKHHGLIDEYRLMVFPLVVGGGKRLFQEGSGRHALQLVEAKPVGSAGVLTLVYQPDRK